MLRDGVEPPREPLGIPGLPGCQSFRQMSCNLQRLGVLCGDLRRENRLIARQVVDEGCLGLIVRRRQLVGLCKAVSCRCTGADGSQQIVERLLESAMLVSQWSRSVTSSVTASSARWYADSGNSPMICRAFSVKA